MSFPLWFAVRLEPSVCPSSTKARATFLAEREMFRSFTETDLGGEAAKDVLSSLEKQILRARCTKMEVLMARALTKESFTAERKKNVVLDQFAGFLRDLQQAWRIPPPARPSEALWRPLVEFAQDAGVRFVAGDEGGTVGGTSAASGKKRTT